MATDLSTKLKQAREALYPTPTQKEVAIKLGITPGAVNRWEQGSTEPSAERLRTLAEWYKVSADWLLSIDKNALGPRSMGIAKAATKEGPPLFLVPVVSTRSLVRWNFDELPSEVLQTSVMYPMASAAAFLVETDALSSSCPSGAYAVVSKTHDAESGSLVLVAQGRAGEPTLRRLVRDGNEQLLVADDMRFPSYSLSDGARIIGRITEVVMRKVL